MTISLTDERFERRLTHCIHELANRAQRECADAETTDVDEGLEAPRHSTQTTMADPVSGAQELWSKLRAWWQPTDDAGEEGHLSIGTPRLVLVIETPFEADAWCAAIREVQDRFLSAAQARQWEDVRALALVGRDVNLREPGNQRTALHYAAGYGEIATAKLLVQLGAQVNARDRAGMTPLGWACLKGHVELSQMLYVESVKTEPEASTDPRLARSKAKPLDARSPCSSNIPTAGSSRTPTL